MRVFILQGLNSYTTFSRIIAATTARTLEDAARNFHGELTKHFGGEGLRPNWGNFQPSGDTAGVIAASRRGEVRDPISGLFVSDPSWTTKRVEAELKNINFFALDEYTLV